MNFKYHNSNNAIFSNKNAYRQRFRYFEYTSSHRTYQVEWYTERSVDGRVFVSLTWDKLVQA